MWNITNVKTPNIGQKKRDDSRQPIPEPMDGNLLYLLQFASWVKDWKNQSKLLLTHETTTEVHQTCTTLVGLTRDMLDEKQFEYILLGQLQSDAIEKRFGWHRKLSGANYIVSVQQVLEAEKSIRVRSLIKFCTSISMKQCLLWPILQKKKLLTSNHALKRCFRL